MSQSCLVAAVAIGAFKVEATVAAVVLTAPACLVACKMIAGDAAVGVATGSLCIASVSSDYHGTR